MHRPTPRSLPLTVLATLLALGALSGCRTRVQPTPVLVLDPVSVELGAGESVQVVARTNYWGEVIEFWTTNPAVSVVELPASSTTGDAGVEDAGLPEGHLRVAAPQGAAAIMVTGVASGSTFVLARGVTSHAGTSGGVLVRTTVRHEEVSYVRDIEPMFRTPGFWYPTSAPCIGCHFGGNPWAAAEMDLSAYAGVRAGSYTISQTPGYSILGETSVSPPSNRFVWDDFARLKWRLMYYRMPPFQYHWLDASHRDGPLVTLRASTAADGGTVPSVYAADVLKSWLQAGATSRHLPRGDERFTVNDNTTLVATFNDDVLPLFTTPGLWYDRAQNCTFCHFSNDARTARDLNLTTFESILNGALTHVQPPGHSILGESRLGSGELMGDYSWDNAYLQMRLRNERMPPGWGFDRNSSSTFGPTVSHPVTGEPISAVDLIGEWVDAGAPNN